MIFEFVFDFKARGQWKHWNDIIKNTEIEDLYNYHDLLVPTIDSARYQHLIDLAIRYVERLFRKSRLIAKHVVEGTSPCC